VYVWKLVRFCHWFVCWQWRSSTPKPSSAVIRSSFGAIHLRRLTAPFLGIRCSSPPLQTFAQKRRAADPPKGNVSRSVVEVVESNILIDEVRLQAPFGKRSLARPFELHVVPPDP
jgi:hypothetical protein